MYQNIQLIQVKNPTECYISDSFFYMMINEAEIMNNLYNPEMGIAKFKCKQICRIVGNRIAQLHSGNDTIVQRRHELNLSAGCWLQEFSIIQNLFFLLENLGDKRKREGRVTPQKRIAFIK